MLFWGLTMNHHIIERETFLRQLPPHKLDIESLVEKKNALHLIDLMVKQANENRH